MSQLYYNNLYGQDGFNLGTAKSNVPFNTGGKDLVMDGGLIKGLETTPIVDTDVATKYYVDQAILATTFKPACRVVITANLGDLADIGGTHDSVNIANGNRVLLTGQTTKTQNGIYIVTDTAGTMSLARSTDVLVAGCAVTILEGTLHNDQIWKMTTPEAQAVLDTDDIEFKIMARRGMRRLQDSANTDHYFEIDSTKADHVIGGINVWTQQGGETKLYDATGAGSLTQTVDATGVGTIACSGNEFKIDTSGTGTEVSIGNQGMTLTNTTGGAPDSTTFDIKGDASSTLIRSFDTGTLIGQTGYLSSNQYTFRTENNNVPITISSHGTGAIQTFSGGNTELWTGGSKRAEVSSTGLSVAPCIRIGDLTAPTASEHLNINAGANDAYAVLNKDAGYDSTIAFKAGGDLKASIVHQSTGSFYIACFGGYDLLMFPYTGNFKVKCGASSTIEGITVDASGNFTSHQTSTFDGLIKAGSASAIDIGESATRFQDVFCDNIRNATETLAFGAGVMTFTGNFLPTSASLSIGTTDDAWTDIFGTTVTCASLMPGGGHATGTIGTDAVRWANGFLVDLKTTNPPTTGSDRRLKHDIKDYQNAIQYIRKLRPVTYVLNDSDSNRYHTGFIAQEVEDVFNDTRNAIICVDENGSYGIRYGEMIALTISGVKDVDKRLRVLECGRGDVKLSVVEDSNQHELVKRIEKLENNRRTLADNSKQLDHSELVERLEKLESKRKLVVDELEDDDKGYETMVNDRIQALEDELHETKRKVLSLEKQIKKILKVI